MKRLFFLMVTTVACRLMAEVSVCGLFTDHMVLQRDKAVPVWGRAAPGESVRVEFLGAVLSTNADARGRWEVRLPAMRWKPEPERLLIRGAKNEIALEDVLVGDVWLVSGQSNAEMPFGWGVVNGKAEMAKSADYPNIRRIKIFHKLAPYPIDGDPGCSKWTRCTPKTLPSTTAEGYFMARELNARTGIPMGIVDDNWSGSKIEPFICEEGMGSVPGLGVWRKILVNSRTQTMEWAERFVAAKESGDWGSVGCVPDVCEWTRQYNAMIAPIVRFPIAGATWYQGCSNIDDGMQYARKLKALVNGWRMKWGYEFPFYVVQLASYGGKAATPAGGNGFSRVRNAQRVAIRDIPRSGLAVAIDIGNGKNIHPQNKYDVGYRLSLWARRDVYGEKDLVVSGPLLRDAKAEGGRMRVSFDHVGSGLMAGSRKPDEPGALPTPSPDGKVLGFAVAGKDGNWHWADAVIDGEEVVVSCGEVGEPVAVRYAHWANPMGSCNLYNREGLPASPFSTAD